MCHEMDDHFAVGGGLEDRAVGFEFVAHHLGVDQIAVMRKRQVAKGKIDDERLRVLEIAGAGGRVAVMADRRAAWKSLQPVLGKHIGHQAHGLFLVKLLPVVGDDAGALLPPMLERVQAEIRQIRRFFVAVDADDSTFLMKLVGRRQRGDVHRNLSHASRPSADGVDAIRFASALRQPSASA